LSEPYERNGNAINPSASKRHVVKFFFISKGLFGYYAASKGA
jgi:hypothetical protein